MTRTRVILAYTALASFILSSQRAIAYEYHGYLLGGGYAAREEFVTETSGVTSNDRAFLSGRFLLDVNKIGTQNYEFQLDARDNHDFFDKLDSARLELTGRNSFRLRQLRVNDPGTNHAYFWTVGRFLPGSNNIVYNDGVEAGVRLFSNHRVGAFFGYRPKVIDEPTPTFGSNLYQAGVFDVYESEGDSWDTGKYVSNLFVSAPQYLSDPPIVTNMWINQSLLHFGADRRVATYLNVSGQSRPKLEDGRLELDERFTSKLSARVVASRLDLTAYRNQRDILEPLAVSSYNQARTTIQYRLSDKKRFETILLAGRRDSDGLQKYELTLGYSLTRILGGHAAGGLQLGSRRGFISQDYFSNGTATYFADDWMLDTSLKLTRQNRYSGVVLNQIIAATNIGIYFSKRLLASAGGEFAADENNTIVSALVTVGYRFGSRELTPLRDVAPPNARY